MQEKRVLAVHDISCVGKCSLTVALPIISAAGIECSVMPTVILSSQTGGFTDFTYRDLTEDMVPITEHWKKLDLKFDGIYTGFLGSFEQIDIVSKIFDDFGKDSAIFVDPVMADNGQLYKVFSDTFPAGMRRLCSKADYIMPNVTEACLMLGEKYRDGPYDKDYIEDLLKKIASMGPQEIVLTGVFFDEKKVGAASYDAESGKIDYSLAETIPGCYYGTGDIFSSVVVSGVMNGLSVAKASAIAVDFTQRSIARTYRIGADVRFGVDFEAGFPKLIGDLSLKDL